MKLPVSVDGNDVVAGFAGADVTVGDLVERAAAEHVVGAAVTIDGRPVALAAPLIDAPIRPGDRIETARHRLAPAQPAGLAVCIVAGVDAGRVFPVPPPPPAPPDAVSEATARIEFTVGRMGADIALASPAVSKHHCTIAVAVDGSVSVRDAGSRNGTVVGGERIGADWMAVAVGEPISVGPTVLVVRVVPAPDSPRRVAASLADSSAGAVAFYRSPVDLAPDPAPAVEAPAPPRRPKAGRPGLIGFGLPIILAGALVWFTGQWLYAMFALMGPMTMLVQLADKAGRNRRVRRTSRRRYRTEVVEFRAELETVVADELARRRVMHPDLCELVRRAEVPSASLWDRRASHPQFLSLALGVGDLYWRPPIEGLASDSAEYPELEQAVDAASVLPVCPLSVDINPGVTLGFAGLRSATMAAARGLLVQLAVHHGPAEVRIVVVTAAGSVDEWEWVKWLPHVRPSSFADGRTLVVVTDDSGLVDGVAIDDVVADAQAGASLFVVIDTKGLADAGDLAVRRLLRRDRLPASGLVIAPTVDGLPDVCDVVVEHHEAVGEATCRWPRESGRSVDFVVGGVMAETAEHVARSIARFSDPDAGGGSASLPARLGLAELLGLSDAPASVVMERWATAGRLAPVVGLSEDGPVALDFAAAGPHVAVVGGRGSGKTEQLLSLVIAMVATQPPERLHLVLWGESFGLLHRLPQVASMVNRVDENAATVVVEGLDREITRRERLRTKGDAAGEAVLVVVIDDVDALTRLVPKSAEDLVRIFRRARGVGIHIVWSTSRSMGGPIGELIDLSTARIVLRVATPNESQELIGSDAAGKLERSLPGRGYLVAGAAEPREIHGGIVSTGAPARVEALEVAPLRLAGSRRAAPLRLGPPDERALVGLLVAAGALSTRPPDLLSPAAAVNNALESPGLLELLGMDSAAGLKGITETWQTTDTDAFLRVPIGVDLDLRPVLLDLKESAHAGMGPHGLLVGATGSGKSELLRTLVTALAATHSPEILSFVLVDFKGGASFASFGRLPHVAGVVTNLADDLALVDRILAALGGEQRRRQELLAAAGNLGNVRDYRAAYNAGTLPPHLADKPLPQLLLIVDEFAELLDQEPAFIDFFLTIGRVGRSLGIHLLLASQRLEEGKLRGLDTYLSYRLGLRTFSAIESRVVLGVPDAYSLPSAPGAGFLKVGNTSFDRFQASYVSGAVPAGIVSALAPSEPERGAPADEREAPLCDEANVDEPSDAAPVEEAADAAEPARDAAGDAAGEEATQTVMGAVVARLDGAARRVHQIWLPPLQPTIPLDALFGASGFVHDPNRGFAAARWPGSGALAVPVGVVDEPELQRQLPLVVDFAAAMGNVVVVGAPQTGKSLLLRSVVLSLAVTHTPMEAQVYAVDFGGGTLEQLADLPHVGAVASRLEPNRVARLVAHVEDVLARREELFRDRAIDSAATFRKMRVDGELNEGEGADVFLIIDGWAAFKERFEHLEATIADIAARGLGHGVHVVVTGNRWMEFRAVVLESIAGRLELRLNTPSDSNIDRKKAAVIKADQPGRGLHPSLRMFQVALPRLDGARTGQDLAAATQLAVEHIASRWEGPTASPVRLLPTEITVADIVSNHCADEPESGRNGVVVGLQEDGMRPWRFDLSGAEPHFAVYGDGESGKTTFLRTWLTGLVSDQPSDRVRVLLLDYRRTLLEVVPPAHLAGYAASEPAANALINDLAEVLASRQPGPDVTPSQLRARSWWTGPDVYVVADDYDLVVTSSGSPLAPLLPFLAQGRDVGLHVVVARRAAGASRAMYEPVLARIREVSNNGLMLSGDREEGPLIGGLRPSQQPQGRGHAVMRRSAPMLVQVAFSGSPSDSDEAPVADSRT